MSTAELEQATQSGHCAKHTGPLAKSRPIPSLPDLCGTLIFRGLRLGMVLSQWPWGGGVALRPREMGEGGSDLCEEQPTLTRPLLFDSGSHLNIKHCPLNFALGGEDWITDSDFFKNPKVFLLSQLGPGIATRSMPRGRPSFTELILHKPLDKDLATKLWQPFQSRRA